MIMQIYVTFYVLTTSLNYFFFKFIHIIELQKLFANNKCKFYPQLLCFRNFYFLRFSSSFSLHPLPFPPDNNRFSDPRKFELGKTGVVHGVAFHGSRAITGDRYEVKANLER